jgi:hypothetical protein
MMSARTGEHTGWIGLLVAALVGFDCPLAAGAAEGILHTTCAPGDKTIVTDYKGPGTSNGRGHDMAAFARAKNGAGVDTDYLMLVWSMDSGKGDGGISFWSWDQPSVWSAPTLKFKVAAPPLREAHSTPVTNMVAADWRTWVLQATTGFSVYNLDSAAAPQLVTNYAIKGSGKGGSGSPAPCVGSCTGSFDAANFDYSAGAVWFLALAAPYLYVAQADNGLNIYKFDDPADPAKITWLKRYDASWFGHRVNQIWVRGNRAVVAAVQENYGVTIIDLSNPTELVKLGSYGLFSAPPIRNAYGWTLNGTTLYAAAKPQASQPSALVIYELDPKTWALGPKKEVIGNCSTGAYVANQDSFAFIGLSNCLHKIARDTKGSPSPADDTWAKVSPAQPNAWKIGPVTADNDFPTPFGNAVFIGNDHHTTPGSAVLCHSGAMDTTKPSVNARDPYAGATGVAVSTGVGLSFTDNLKPWTISTTSLPIRVQGSTTAVPGYYSYQLNTVNFRPASQFAASTIYEVVVTNKIQDLAGNGAVPSVATFRTKP